MKVVFLADDPVSGRQVAIAVLGDYRDGFEQEVALARRVTSPRVAAILDSGVDEDGRQGDVFLGQAGAPVVPTWWDRTAEGQGMSLVWPAGYARETGKPRRERIDDVAAVTEKRRRTTAYRDAWERHGRLQKQIEQAGEDRARLTAKYGW